MFVCSVHGTEMEVRPSVRGFAKIVCVACIRDRMIAAFGAVGNID